MMDLVLWLINFTDVIHSYCDKYDACEECKWYKNNTCELCEVQEKIWEDNK